MSVLLRRDAFNQLIAFSLPIILGQLGLILIGTGDMLIAGHYSRECLAAIGLAISISNPIMMLCLGLLFAISPLLAQKRGQGEDPRDYFWTVMKYGLIVGIVGSVVHVLSIFLVPILDYGPELNPLIQQYLLVTSPSILGICLFQTTREFLQSQEKTFSSNFLAMTAAGLNVFLNYSFVFGKFGFPDLHEAGLAWASLSVRFFMGIGLFALTYVWWSSPKIKRPGFFRELFQLGYPITIGIFFEVMAFCSVTLFVGKFHEIQTAANNIVLNIASVAFMIPLSISAAVGVKVGHSFGERNIQRIKTFAEVSLLTSFCYALIISAFFFLLPHPILSLFSRDEQVLEWGKRLLFLVCCFQLFDGTQITLSGILRGLSVTRAPSLAIFFGYWIIGIPLGYSLGFFQGFEAQGFWIGLAISLALVAGMLSVILKKKLRSLKEGAGVIE
jgi:MATE family multidrug resistance protein